VLGFKTINFNEKKYIDEFTKALKSECIENIDNEIIDIERTNDEDINDENMKIKALYIDIPEPIKKFFNKKTCAIEKLVLFLKFARSKSCTQITWTPPTDSMKTQALMDLELKKYQFYNNIKRLCKQNCKSSAENGLTICKECAISKTYQENKKSFLNQLGIPDSFLPEENWNLLNEESQAIFKLLPNGPHMILTPNISQEKFFKYFLKNVSPLEFMEKISKINSQVYDEFEQKLNMLGSNLDIQTSLDYINEIKTKVEANKETLGIIAATILNDFIKQFELTYIHIKETYMTTRIREAQQDLYVFLKNLGFHTIPTIDKFEKIKCENDDVKINRKEEKVMSRKEIKKLNKQMK
jgi:hypothetical protein